MKPAYLDIDSAHRITRFFFHKYKDFWDFRGCNFYTINGGFNWCLKKDGVILSVSPHILTICRLDYMRVPRFEVYRVPPELLLAPDAQPC